MKTSCISFQSLTPLLPKSSLYPESQFHGLIYPVSILYLNGISKHSCSLLLFILHHLRDSLHCCSSSLLYCILLCECISLLFVLCDGHLGSFQSCWVYSPYLLVALQMYFYCINSRTAGTWGLHVPHVSRYLEPCLRHF